MSADLFEAFVGTQEEGHKEHAPQQSSVLLQLESFSRSSDTWQPWPITTEPTTQWPPEHQAQNLWETDQDGNEFLFDASQDDIDPVVSAADDDFGDFEEVANSHVETSTPNVEPVSATLDLLTLDESDTKSQALRATKDDYPAYPKSLDKDIQSSTKPVALVDQHQSSPPVLDLDDDWGDFESTEAPHVAGSRPRTPKIPSASPSKQIQQRIRPAQVKNEDRTVPHSHNVRNEPSRPDPLDDELWDDFETSEAGNVTPTNKSARRTSVVDASQSISFTEIRTRPTNVPPPAVLLAWLPRIFSKLASQSRQTDTSLECGKAAVQIYRVSARVIAGRAARWKRDSILTQSMRIGAAGRSGGMKLTVLDKGESRKEDQAAAEVITSWGRVSHLLNAAMARAKVQKPPMALSINLAARSVAGHDVVSATHVCAVCGLRRNERVIGIDVNVSDTFGEFWIEHWGHKDCSDIWYTFNDVLDRR